MGRAGVGGQGFMSAQRSCQESWLLHHVPQTAPTPTQPAQLHAMPATPHAPSHIVPLSPGNSAASRCCCA